MSLQNPALLSQVLGTGKETRHGKSLRIRQCENKDALALARLHMENLRDRLGVRLLEAYYRGFIEGERNFCVCGEVDGTIVAYVGAVSSRVRLLKSVVGRHAFTLLNCLLARPSLVLELLSRLRLWLTPWLRTGQLTPLSVWEYRPVITAKNHRNQGIAQLLLAAAEAMLVKRGATEVFLSVAKTNEAAQWTYRKSGFHLTGEQLSGTLTMAKKFASEAALSDVAKIRSGVLPAKQRSPLFSPASSRFMIEAPSHPSPQSHGCLLCSAPEPKTIAAYQGKYLQTCPHCTVSFVFPQPASVALIAHFENGGTVGFDCMEDKLEKNREKVLTRVAHYIHRKKKGGSILDIGCSTGFFLARIFATPGWQIWGLELSQRSAEIAGKRGIRVSHGNVHQVALADGGFDVITVLDTFCYFPRPQAELAEFRRLLKPDGLLVLELPLASSRIWRTSGSVGRFFSRATRPLLESSDHLFYYTPESISRLLEKCGLAVQSILPLPANRQPFRLQDLVYRVYSAFSSVMCLVSGSRIFLGPRFLVAAAKETAANAPGKSTPVED